MHKPKLLSSGRVCFPTIIQYEMPDGEIRDLPPYRMIDPDLTESSRRSVTVSLPFKLVIHDLPAYEELARAGAIYSMFHAAGASVATDNRKTA